MITIFLDTSYIVALINERDQYHERALRLADQYEGYKIVITDAILLYLIYFHERTEYQYFTHI